MIRAVALDDEPLALRLLKAFCSRTSLVSLDAAFTSPVDMMVYAGNHDFDLIFLDIQMPGISGLDFLRQFPRPVMAIFTTAFSEFAVEGFNLRAVDYLLKPFEFDRFQQAVERARLYSGFGKEARVGEDIFVKADNGLQRIQTTPDPVC
ncbi:MAG: response regulator [Chitinophagaceae bacterium]